jgi:hypothetical protein
LLDVAESAEARVIAGCVPAVDVAIGVKLMTHSCCFVDSDKGQMRTAITGPVFAERTGSIGKSCAYLSVVGKREASESLQHHQPEVKYIDGHQFVGCSEHQALAIGGLKA